MNLTYMIPLFLRNMFPKVKLSISTLIKLVRINAFRHLVMGPENHILLWL